LVVKIAADDDDGKKTEKNIFIGRDKEINEILGDLKENKSNRGTRLLLVGESGIGKSALLDEIHRRLTEEEQDQRNRVFVGYYSKKESLIAESESLLYPFSVVLKSLINSAKESQQLGEKIDSTMARVKKGLLKFGKEQGMKIGVAIIEDVAKKAGLDQTLDVGKAILKDIGSEKTSLMLAQQYIADHRDEARQSYLEIFKAIADEFKERRFVLILDQFESVGKASTDFFLNFVKFLMPQERFDIIVSFRTDDTTWNDSAARKVYEDLERKMTYDLNAKKISIEGLSAEDIGKWIKQVRGMSLPLVPDLQRIRENSAGFPMLLGEWIKSSNDLKDYDKIKREKLCTLIIGLEDGLEDEQDQVRLDRMSILPYPLKLERLATYLQMNGNVDLVTSFVKRLSRYRIFDQDLEWFRHELIRRCFEDRLGNQRRSGYHQRAAEFFERLIEEEKQRQKQREQGEEVNIQNNDITNIEERYSILMSCAYHLDMSGGTYHEKSFTYNKLLAIYASKIGDLDIAEYLGHIKDKMECLYYMTRNGYDIWGRYEEAASNYQSLLKYYDSINDSRMRVSILSKIAIIHAIKGEHEQAMDLFKDNLETAREIGDQELISGSLNNIALIHDNKAEYDQALSCTTKAWRLQARWEISKE
jgi:tetratricopeptide (TPR) repeat protein